MIIWLICLGLVLSLSPDAVLAQAELPSSGKDVQVYIDGREYSSVDDYQQQKIKAVIEETIKESGKDDFDLFLKELMAGYSSGKLKDLSEEELRDIIHRLRDGEFTKPFSSPPGSEMDQMEEMLEDYKKDHPQNAAVGIDLQKIKTINLSPGGKGVAKEGKGEDEGKGGPYYYKRIPPKNETPGKGSP